MTKLGRPPRIPINSVVRIRISGDAGGLPLQAKVIRNHPALVFQVVEGDPVWANCTLNERQCRVVKAGEQVRPMFKPREVAPVAPSKPKRKRVRECTSGLKPHGGLPVYPMRRPGHCMLDLDGVPTMPDDIALVLQHHGALNDEQEFRAKLAIERACTEIKRRLFEAWREKPVIQEDDDVAVYE